jgi:multidrug efflux pump subunit AcrB
VALTLSPMMSSKLLRSEAQERGFSGMIHRHFEAVRGLYVRLLARTLNYRPVTLTLWAIVARLFSDTAIPGWASTVVPIYFLGGIQLLATGVIGEYLAKIYAETKRRPRFIIEKIV